MRRSLQRIAPLAIVSLLAACTGEHGTSPVQPPRSDVLAGTLTLVCDPTFGAAKKDARAFFASSTDPVFTILRDMQSFYKTGGAVAATPKGYDALQRIAQARGTSAQAGTATDGDALTKDLLACMSVGPIPAGFSVVSALSAGIFEVRGDAVNTGPGLAFAAAAGQKTPASPLWGVEAPSGWAATFNGGATRFLLYGAPRPVSGFTTEPPSVDQSNVAFTGFDISTIPVMPGLSLVGQGSSGTPLLAGICIDPGGGSSQPANRILHASTTSTTILALAVPAFCAGTTALRSAPTDDSWLLSLARRAAGWFAPRPLYAFRGGVGGLTSGLSPFGPVAVQAQNVSLTFGQQPTDGKISAPISPPVTVRASTPAGTPVAGISVTLLIFGNNGQPATFVAGTNVAVTNDAGLASFPALQLTKAGGYTLQATGSLAGTATQTVTSVLFNVQGQ